MCAKPLFCPRVCLSVLFLAVLQPIGITAGDEQDQLRAQYEQAEAKLKGGDHSPKVWAAILDGLYRLDQPAKALGASRVAAEEYAKHPQVAGRIARAYYRGGRLDEAAELLNQLGDLPKDPVAALVLSKLFHAEGKLNLAIQAVDLGLSRAPDDAELLYQGALLHSRLGENAQALRFYVAAEDTAASLQGYPGDLILAWSAGRGLIHRTAGSRVLNAVKQDGLISFKLPEQLPLPTIEVQLNDHQPVKMLLDLSGNTLLSIDSKLAQAAGVTGLGGAKLQDIVGQTSSTQWALTDRLVTGACEVFHVTTQFYPFDENDLPGVKGVLGSGIFTDKRVTVDFEASTVSVAKSFSEARGQRSDSLHAVIETRFLSGDRAVMPVLMKDRILNGIFDMGTPLTCFATESLSSLKQPSELRESALGDLPAQVSSPVPFMIGRRRFFQRQAVALPFIGKETSRSLGVQVDIVLGWDIFKEMRRFAIDAPAGQIVIDWLPRQEHQLEGP